LLLGTSLGLPRGLPARAAELGHLPRELEGKQMSNSTPGMLIFGAMPAPRPRGMPSGMEGSSRAIVDDIGLGSSRVSVETVAANLKAAIEQVGHLIRVVRDSKGELGVAHVDINLAIAADGSVGLVGTADSRNAKGTLTVRLEPRGTTQSPRRAHGTKSGSPETVTSSI